MLTSQARFVRALDGQRALSCLHHPTEDSRDHQRQVLLVHSHRWHWASGFQVHSHQLPVGILGWADPLLSQNIALQTKSGKITQTKSVSSSKPMWPHQKTSKNSYNFHSTPLPISRSPVPQRFPAPRCWAGPSAARSAAPGALGPARRPRPRRSAPAWRGPRNGRRRLPGHADARPVASARILSVWTWGCAKTERTRIIDRGTWFKHQQWGFNGISWVLMGLNLDLMRDNEAIR